MAKANGNGKARPISLALQGGGAHGAYTWGILDRLSEEESLAIEAISATSAGAINAVAYAAGLAAGGPEGARASLEQMNFDAVHASGLKLFLSATNVETGKVRVFSKDEITADAVLASACLPQTFQAVEIGEEAFWDGGYMGNPSLFPLIYSGAPQDVLLVLLNPLVRPGVPRRAAEINERLNEISFNASLIGELRAIAFVQRLIDDGMLKEPVLKKYRRLNVHAIRGGQDLLGYGMATKYDARWRFLLELREKGRAAAGHWLSGCAQHVGTKTSSFDIRKEFLEG